MTSPHDVLHDENWWRRAQTMPIDKNQTWVCALTGSGTSALATLAIMGPQVWNWTREFFVPAQKKVSKQQDDWVPSPGRPYYGWWGDHIKDDVVLWRPENMENDCDAEPRLEIHCHGGQALREGLLQELKARGAVTVDWPSWRRRQGATPWQIEYESALSHCQTALTAKLAMNASPKKCVGIVRDILRDKDTDRAKSIARFAQAGALLTRPMRLVFFGRANVGKSSLINALAGFERAVVADLPGTTRDVVRADTVLAGWPVQLTDGAGFRDSTESSAVDPLEKSGQQFLSNELAQADVAVLVLDALANWHPLEKQLAKKHAPHLVVANKTDLVPTQALPNGVSLGVSARTKQGLDALVARCLELAMPNCPNASDLVPISARQRRWFSQAALGNFEDPALEPHPD